MKLKRNIMLAVLSVLIGVWLAACSGGAASDVKPSGSADEGSIFNVTATEFKFTPNTFRAKVGQKVTFKLTNHGTMEHSFVIRSPDDSQELAKITTQPGETKTVEFTPTEVAKYPIQCDVPGHKAANMTGELAVN